jgi:hypothetical protein
MRAQHGKTSLLWHAMSGFVGLNQRRNLTRGAVVLYGQSRVSRWGSAGRVVGKGVLIEVISTVPE